MVNYVIPLCGPTNDISVFCDNAVFYGIGSQLIITAPITLLPRINATDVKNEKQSVDAQPFVLSTVTYYVGLMPRNAMYNL